MVVRTPEQSSRRKQVLPPWLRAKKNGTTIVLGLKDCNVGEGVGGEERVVVKTAVRGKEKKCPCCGSAKLYRHSLCKPREVLQSWSNGRRVYLELHRQRWRCCNCRHTFAEGRELYVVSKSGTIVPSELMDISEATVLLPGGLYSLLAYNVLFFVSFLLCITWMYLPA